MSTKYKNTYRNETTRLKNWDYASHGFYFVTICTKNKQPYFGNIVPVGTQDFASLQPTEIGGIANKYWTEIPNHFPFVELDEFVIMPDHVHGILFFNKPNYQDWKTNSFKPQSKNLASVIRGYKAAVKKYAVLHRIEFEWQPRYYDHVINSVGTQNFTSLHTIRKYIENNPIKWVSK
jgi:REP element-mobilizing transposase RayT